jgi:hypothetical protein
MFVNFFFNFDDVSAQKINIGIKINIMAILCAYIAIRFAAYISVHTASFVVTYTRYVVSYVQQVTILRLVKLQLPRQRCSRLERFFIVS